MSIRLLLPKRYSLRFRNKTFCLLTLIMWLVNSACNQGERDSHLQDTIEYQNFLDTYTTRPYEDNTFKKPYKLVLPWSSIKVVDEDNNTVSETDQSGYILGFTETNEKQPRQVLMMDHTYMSRAYFLDSIFSKSELAAFDKEEIAPSLRPKYHLETWSAYRFARSEQTKQIAKMKVSINLFKSGEDITMIQIAEPLGNIYTYRP